MYLVILRFYRHTDSRPGESRRGFAQYIVEITSILYGKHLFLFLNKTYVAMVCVNLNRSRGSIYPGVRYKRVMDTTVGPYSSQIIFFTGLGKIGSYSSQLGK